MFPIFPWFPPDEIDIDAVNWARILTALDAGGAAYRGAGAWRAGRRGNRSHSAGLHDRSRSTGEVAPRQARRCRCNCRGAWSRHPKRTCRLEPARMGRLRHPLFRRDRRGAGLSGDELGSRADCAPLSNDICHPDGKIPFAIDRAAPASGLFLAASRKALERARQLGFVIAHVHIAFSPDYADLPKNARLFRKAAELGAVKLGSWGAEPYEGFEPRAGEIFLIHKGNSAFFATGLQATSKPARLLISPSAGLRRNSRSSTPSGTRPTAVFASRSSRTVALRRMRRRRKQRSKSCRCWRK